jgi:hypothetical protein
MGETEEHIKLALWLDNSGILWLHVPNEGERSNHAQVQMKRMGLKKGAPDFLIFEPPPRKVGKVGLAIELKRADGLGRRPEEQKKWLANLRSKGWEAHFCDGYEEALTLLRNLGYKERPVYTLEILPPIK